MLNLCLTKGEGSNEVEENMQELRDYSEVRYYYEHRLLPDWFYNETDEFVGNIRKGKDYFLYGAMSILCEENGQEMQFTEEQYKVIVCKSSKSVSLIRIEMPKPEEQYGCYQVYLVFSVDYHYKKYFTVERGASSEARYLCDWDMQGNHYNYGQCDGDMRKIEKRIMRMREKKEVGYQKKRTVLLLFVITACLGCAGAAYCVRKF